MPKHKTLIVFAVVIAFSFSLIGCGMLTSRSTGPDDLAGIGGELPEWLLLAHRSAEGPGTERDDDLLEVADDDDLVIADNDLPNGDSDQGENVTAPSGSQDTQTAQAPQSSQSSPSGGSSSSGSDEPEFGTREYLVWLKKQQEKAPTVGEEAEDDEEDDSDWWDSPSGSSSGGFFGN